MMRQSVGRTNLKSNPKEILVLIGHYGSGKTELALNFAIKAAKSGKKTVLVDLDIVNPYFRSAEQSDLLREAGVDLIVPPYANTNVDLPVLSARVSGVFTDGHEYVVFDVGGDGVGATALGRYFHEFSRIENGLRVLFVVNPRRPLCCTEDGICAMMEEVKRASRLQLDGLINNANLANETTADDLLDAQDVLARVSARTACPIAYTCGQREVLKSYASINAEGHGELFPIQTYMRPAWLNG